MTETATNAAELWRARYGANSPLADALWNETLATLLAHRSVRAYRSEPLPAGTLETLVAAAQSASSSSNLQAWSVIAVEDAARKDRLATLGGDQQFIRACPLFLVWIADLARLEAIGTQRGLVHDGLDYLEMFMLALVDAALAAQNAAVAAESLGLGVVYIGAMRNHPEAVAAELCLPPRSFAVFGMCVGYPDAQRLAAIKPRLPQRAVLHRETYDADALPDAVTAYDATMATFYREQQMRTSGPWAEHSLRRVAGPQTLSGRDRIREALHKLGFELR